MKGNNKYIYGNYDLNSFCLSLKKDFMSRLKLGALVVALI